MNLESKVYYLKTNMEGIWMDKGKVVHKHYPQVLIWREAEVRRRLHLTPQYKQRLQGWLSSSWRVVLPVLKMNF